MSKNIIQLVHEGNGQECYDFEPKPATDKPCKRFDALDFNARAARVRQLAARVERGEHVFHPDEAPDLLATQQRGVNTFIEYSRGYSATSNCCKPSQMGG
jgi:hypothetical protein